MIRLALPLIEDDDIAAVSTVLRTGNLVQGAEVRAFEDTIARLSGSGHAVAVTNCTAALEVALRAVGVGAGDEVAVAAYSWVSTANVVELVGARPVFVDIDVHSHNMSAAALDHVLAEHPGVRAVLPVHTFGNLAGVAHIVEVADRHGIPVIEDAACALGAALDGRPAGSWGRIGCFSFHPRKAVTTGEGGVLSTDDADVATLARTLRNHGLDPDAPGPDFVRAASNLRMTEFQAALGRTQVAKLERILAVRRGVAARYEALFDGTGFVLPSPGPEHVLQSYVVLTPEGSKPAAELVAEVRARGVEVSVGTWHLPLTTFYRERYGYRPGQFPGVDEVFARAVSLPIHHELSLEDQSMVFSTVAGALEGGG